ncbi:hypothetical protein [Actinoallomurus soli]|uniref:hypothetical protein n=1 Tax=Actinoallomurus soli TaxID=2952535 RepID=UPI002093FF86|nr:hypothetical protein [Actinoallomurus soli]MCO5971260.1 hypothetical protein [Actinoallomurus soli]
MAWLAGLPLGIGLASGLGLLHSPGGRLLCILATPLLLHAVQMAWLVAVRFDDTAVTIIRPWRRRRIPWDDIAGLIYTEHVNTGRTVLMTYRLRLVLKSSAPPEGRHLTYAMRKQPYATGPVVMTLFSIDPGAGSIGAAPGCRERVLAELERHGLPRPGPYAMRFRSPKYTLEEETLAVSMDVRKGSHNTHPVTVNHRGPHDDRQADLIDTVLPELARTHAAAPVTEHNDRYTIFFFEGPDAEQAAADFITAAREIVPTGWRITPTALPEPPASAR